MQLPIHRAILGDVCLHLNEEDLKRILRKKLELKLLDQKRNSEVFSTRRICWILLNILKEFLCNIGTLFWRWFVFSASYLPPAPAQAVLAPVPHGNYSCAGCVWCHKYRRRSLFLPSIFRYRDTISLGEGVVSRTATCLIYLLACACGKGCVGQTERNNCQAPCQG